MEDFNHLLDREQTEYLRAATSSCENARAAHLKLARGYAARIAGHPYPYPYSSDLSLKEVAL